MVSRIIGDKTYIRPITYDDTALIVRWRNQDNVKSYFFYRDEFTEEIHLNWMKNKVEKGEVVQFIVCLKDNDMPIGSTYLRDINEDDKSAEYGVFIGEEGYRGQGIGKEILALTMKYSWDELGLKKLYARAIATNQASVQSFLHSGFEIVETVGNVACSDGTNEDMVFMSINRP